MDQEQQPVGHLASSCCVHVLPTAWPRSLGRQCELSHVALSAEHAVLCVHSLQLSVHLCDHRSSPPAQATKSCSLQLAPKRAKYTIDAVLEELALMQCCAVSVVITTACIDARLNTTVMHVAIPWLSQYWLPVAAYGSPLQHVSHLGTCTHAPSLATVTYLRQNYQPSEAPIVPKRRFESSGPTSTSWPGTSNAFRAYFLAL